MYRDIAQRMEDVVGAPMRVPPLDDTALDARTQALVNRLQAFHGLPPQKKAHDFYGMLARSPGTFAAFLDMGTVLSTDSTIGGRERELAVLRVGWLCGGPFVWGEHVIVARREGITPEEIERVIEGSQADGWGAKDRALLAAVEELHTDAMIADATWAELSRHFDERQLVELLMLVGHYHLTVFVQNALRVRLNPYNEGLEAR
jgi:alkylhydroperoxidase family enzyme